MCEIPTYLVFGVTIALGGCLADSAAGPSDADVAAIEDVSTQDGVAGLADTRDPACKPACADPGGTCVDGACDCLSGYSGETCATRDPCFGDPCVHGTCSAASGGFLCTCDEGYTGQTCADAAGPRVAVSITALGMPEIGDAVWDLEVRAGEEVVWQRRLTSSGYGDGGGSASFTGPCVPGESAVDLWLVGVYADTVSEEAAGGFNAAIATPAATDFINPTWTDSDGDGARSAGDLAMPLRRTFECLAGADVFVPFDVALFRPAQQGFFDIAVDLAGVFCSAKFDCCHDEDHDGSCGDDEVIRLLFDADSQRAPTMVLEFACTSGEVTPELLLDDITLDCSHEGQPQPFAADITMRPAGAQGYHCTVGSDGMSSCAGVTEAEGVDADTYLYQYALFPGTETINEDEKVYWNLAFGVKPDAIGACRLRTRGTALDANGPLSGAQGTLPSRYPYIQWDVPLGACTSEALSFQPGETDVFVTPQSVDDAGPSFAYHMSLGGEPEAY